ncbi:hypothetical protein LI328DRAFT_162327 [Trichoderma asperelloides]|nr:hypothetical protein LI328DRAFT_162327 [Trichoderma asperelloides]
MTISPCSTDQRSRWEDVKTVWVSLSAAVYSWQRWRMKEPGVKITHFCCSSLIHYYVPTLYLQLWFEFCLTFFVLRSKRTLRILGIETCRSYGAARLSTSALPFLGEI